MSEFTNGQYILTADIGGSHITAAVCNITTDTIINESLTRLELNSKGSAESILWSWQNAFDTAQGRSGVQVSGLGMAMPGPFDYENGISYIQGFDKYDALYGMDVKQYFANRLNLYPSEIRFRNDAEATIAGEVLAGAGKSQDNVMGVTLGTGFGSAFCSNQVTKDLNLGSAPYKTSIADDHLSTRWFLKRYTELTGVILSGVKQLAILAQSSEQGRQIFAEFALNMSDFLADPLNRFKPDKLILCGNIAKSHPLFLPLLRSRLSDTNIVLAELGEQAALIGAAGLFKQTISRKRACTTYK